MGKELLIQLTLLKIVSEDLNVKKLKHFGLSFIEIADLIEFNITNGYLLDIEGEVSITDLGKAFLVENAHLLKETDKSKWIDLDFKNKIKKIGKDEVFLPSKRELSFLKKLS